MDAEDRMHMEKLRKKYAGQRQANMGEEILTTGVDESSIAAHQYKEDQERLEQMRAKEAEGVTFTQSSFDIKLCLLCMGEGKVKEHYGYREMQKHCSHCDGDGVIQYGGAVKKSPNEPPKAVAASVRKPRRHTAADSMDWGTPEDKSRARVVKSIAKLEKQLSTYQQEVKDSEVRQAASKDAQEQQLLHDLLAQLHIRMGSIQAKLEARKTELAAIPNADDDNTVEADNEPKAQDQSNEESQVCADTSSLDELSRSLDGSGARDRDGNEDNEDNVSETDTPSRQADKSMDAVNSLVADLVVSDPAPVPSGDLD